MLECCYTHTNIKRRNKITCINMTVCLPAVCLKHLMENANLQSDTHLCCSVTTLKETSMSTSVGLKSKQQIFLLFHFTVVLLLTKHCILINFNTKSQTTLRIVVIFKHLITLFYRSSPPCMWDCSQLSKHSCKLLITLSLNPRFSHVEVKHEIH